MKSKYDQILERAAKRRLSKNAAKSKRKGKTAHDERVAYSKKRKKAKLKRKLQSKARAITRRYAK